jgi:hypothetical protein
MSAAQFSLPYMVAFKPNGVGVPGAKMFFYAPGTTTKRPVYSTSALTTQLSNPVVADGAGRFPNIYLDNALTYKIVIYNKWVRKFDGPYHAKWWGVVADNLTDNHLAAQAAINAVSAFGGGELHFPAGITKHSGLIFKNKIQYRGAGRDTASTTGTILLYTGTGDGRCHQQPDQLFDQRQRLG